MTTDKKINLKLVGLDSNAFSLLGAFQRQARKEGWTQTEIDVVLKEARSSDYYHLIETLTEYCKNPVGTKEEMDE